MTTSTPIRPPGKSVAKPTPLPGTQGLWPWVKARLGVCNHRWLVAHQQLMPSAYELMAGKGDQLFKGGRMPPRWVFAKAFVTVFQCSHCSQVKQTVVRNPK